MRKEARGLRIELTALNTNSLNVPFRKKSVANWAENKTQL